MPGNLRSLHFAQAKSPPGFTLIELLVVIVLISIIISMATLAITTGTPKQRLKTEAQRFSALLQLAQDDSLLNGIELGIQLTENSYQFVQLSDNGWQAISNNASLRLRQLPQDMLLELELDFQPSSLKSTLTKVGKVSKVGDVDRFNDDKTTKPKPNIYLLSSGEIAPAFMLRFLLTDTDVSFTVQGNEDGSLEVQFHST
ncbi:MAG: type II secretion system minor pseudopilin GspH [Gammaproteobacteria bacterium]|nr:type II secretion system minor pseudopilin GspH [Gammaproteobacteria bacterium]